jgi:hypothetical protein
MLTLNFWLLPAAAQNFNDALRLSYPGLGSSARALGMGNAFTSVSDDFSAVFFNPAGLGLIRSFEISGGLDHGIYNNDVTFFENISPFSNSTTNFIKAGLVMPLPTTQGSMVLGFGYNRQKSFRNGFNFDGFNSGSNSMIQDLTSVNDDIPFRLGLSYPLYDQQTDNYLKDTTIINGMLNQSGTILEDGKIDAWSFSGSVEIAKNVFIGGTFNYLTGNYKRDREYFEDDTRDIYDNSTLTDPNDPVTSDFNTFYFNDIIDWNITGWDFKFGAYYKFLGFLSFGGAIKFPSQITVDEKYYVNSSSYFVNDGGYDLNPAIDSRVEYRVSTPYEFTGAASMKILFLLVSAEATYIDYSQMEFTDGFDPSYRSQRNKEIKELFKGVANLNIGAEVKIPFTQIRVRGGAMYFPSPYKNDPVEFDRKYLTVGAGVILGSSFSVDAAFIHGWWENFGDNYGSGISRTFQKVTEERFIINFAHRF